MTALDAGQAELTEVGDQTPGYIWRYSEEVRLPKRGECHLELLDAECAADYAQQPLSALDPSFTRIAALTIVDLMRAREQSNDIDEAAQTEKQRREVAFLAATCYE